MRGSLRVLCACLLVVAACGDDGAGDGATTTVAATTSTGAAASSTTGATVPSGGGGGCTVAVTGGQEASWNGPDDISAFTSDYWYTEDELRQQFDFLGDPTQGTFDEVLGAGLPIFTFFLANCTGTDGQIVSLFVSDATTRADFPMGPGSFVIAPSGLFGGGPDMPPAQFSVLFGADNEAVWGTDEPGSLEITGWDGGGIEGTFAFTAVERLVDNPRTVMVSGSFAFTCRASVACG